MSDYTPPIEDMSFVLREVLGFQSDVLDADTMDAVLEEAAKMASGVLAPLNRKGDEIGAVYNDDHSVTTAPGWKDAYKAYCEAGWNAVPFEEEYGGQGLPWPIAFALQEMWQGANLAFGLCPMLTQSAIDALQVHGTDEQKEYYLPKLISGEWSGTMNLTEPHAGSDLGLLRTKAERADDGTYRITGQKIWITYGEHDMTDNIVHTVLARLPDAPDDVKGISLFIVPKFLEDGTRNDVKCVGLDHKMGIHASPTCVMQYGDEGGAVGYLVGKEHEGLKCMFTMMNNARLGVGLQGLALAERAYQSAVAYAAERVQGKSFATGERVSIDQHADVQRMLKTMQAHILGARALAYEAGVALDKAEQGDADAQAKVDLLTPLVKAWCTDIAVEVSSLTIQVHGGCGFIEETGVAQFYRDARILPIYEGTNGIQSADLAFRKVLRDGGAVAKSYIAHMREHLDAEICDALEGATKAIVLAGGKKNMDRIGAMCSPYLKAFSIAACAAMMVRRKKAGQKECVDFYLTNILPLALAHLRICTEGAKEIA